MTVEEEAVADSEIRDLLAKGAVVEVCSRKGFQSPVFMVPKRGGGWRPVINLKRLNLYMEVSHFKMEGLTSVRSLLQRNDLLVKIDLKDAYLTVPIHPAHHKYLQFLWKGRLLQFSSLPFGLATAPRTFTKIMKPVVSHLRLQGLRIVIYIDDILLMASSQSQVTEHSQMLLNLLKNLGFVINQSKSVLDPTHSIEFLGLMIDSESLTFRVPEEKIRKVQKECRHFLNKGVASPRDLSHLIGLLSSFNLAVSPAPLHYRALQRMKHRCLKISGSWDYQESLDGGAQQDLRFWTDRLPSWNGKSILLQTLSSLQMPPGLGGGAVYQAPVFLVTGICGRGLTISTG